MAPGPGAKTIPFEVMYYVSSEVERTIDGTWLLHQFEHSPKPAKNEEIFAIIDATESPIFPLPPFRNKITIAQDKSGTPVICIAAHESTDLSEIIIIWRPESKWLMVSFLKMIVQFHFLYLEWKSRTYNVVSEGSNSLN